MRITQSEDELVITETPASLWAFGLLFAGVGAVVIWGALGGFSDWAEIPGWQLALAFFMAAVAITAGVRIISGAPVTRVAVNRKEKSVLVTRCGFSGRKETAFDFDEVDRFRLVEEKDSGGDPVWSVGIRLTNGETVKVTSLPRHFEQFQRPYIFQTNEFMRKQVSSSEMILGAAAEDESGAEIR